MWGRKYGGERAERGEMTKEEDVYARRALGRGLLKLSAAVPAGHLKERGVKNPRSPRKSKRGTRPQEGEESVICGAQVERRHALDPHSSGGWKLSRRASRCLKGGGDAVCPAIPREVLRGP